MTPRPREMQARMVPLLMCLLLSCLAISNAQISVQVFPTIREGKFQGQEFTRLCSVTGTESATFEWLRDDVPVLTATGANLRLTISSVDFVHEGSYSCRAILEDSTVIGPVNAGELVVLNSGMINAPSVQYVHHQQSTHLNCSYPGAFTTWRKDGEIVSGNLDAPSFSAEGQYKCSLFYENTSLQIQAGIDLDIFLHVFVPVDILGHPPPYQRLDGNPPLSLAVDFSGRQAQNMSTRWFRDGSEVSTGLISNTYSPSQLSGTTEITFTAVTRSDKGVYRVVIASEVGYDVYPLRDVQEEVSFQVDVIVPPRPPTNFASYDEFTNTTVFKWSRTNQNADEAADTFVLHITFENGTLFRNETFPGGVSERRVTELIPGTNFSAILVAKNPDGEAQTEPIWFHTAVGYPKLNGAQVTRVNGSHFTAQVDLAYTGGGGIMTIIVYFSNSENTKQQELEIHPTPSPDSNLVWSGDFIITDSKFAPEGELSFRVAAKNEYNFKSNGRVVTVSPYVTEPTTTEPSQELDTMIVTLIAVVAGTVTIAVLILILVLVAVCYCKRSKKYSVNSSPEDQSAEEKELPKDHPTITRGATSDDNLVKATINLGSVPSIQLPPDHSPDNRYIDSEHFRKGHRRFPSDASSKASSSRSHPISTASNSPNTMLMMKYQNERNAGYTADSAVSLTNDNGMFGSRSQLSQTESETMAKAGHLHSYSQVGFTNSTCSSVHSSQQSIPMYTHRHGTQPFDHPHHHRRNYSLTSSISGIKEEDSASMTPSQLQFSQHYRPQPYQNHSLSISSNEMDVRPPSESICTCSMTTGGEMSPEYVYMQPSTDPVQVSVV